ILKNHLDLRSQLAASNHMPALRPLEPGVISRDAHLQHLADPSDRKGLEIRFDKCEFHACSFAKNAAAFFKISRSIISRAFSLRSFWISATRAPSPLGAQPGLSDNCFTQYRTLLESTPRLLAAWGMV